MTKTTPAEILAAITEARRQQIIGGPYFGCPLPKQVPGSFRLPLGYGELDNAYDPGGSLTDTLFFYPIVIPTTETINGLTVRLGGSGDTGNKARLMIALNDGNFTVAKDFGEVTATGSLTTTTAVASWTPPKPDAYWLAYWVKEATAHICMAPYVSQTAVGFTPLGNTLQNLAGCMSVATSPLAYYKAITYAVPGATLTPPDSAYLGATSYGTRSTASMGGVAAIWFKA